MNSFIPHLNVCPVISKVLNCFQNFTSAYLLASKIISVNNVSFFDVLDVSFAIRCRNFGSGCKTPLWQKSAVANSRSSVGCDLGSKRCSKSLDSFSYQGSAAIEQSSFSNKKTSPLNRIEKIGCIIYALKALIKLSCSSGLAFAIVQFRFINDLPAGEFVDMTGCFFNMPFLGLVITNLVLVGLADLRKILIRGSQLFRLSFSFVHLMRLLRNLLIVLGFGVKPLGIKAGPKC